MALRLLITRAEPGAADTARRIAAMDGEAILAPMLSIRTIAGDADVAGAQALLFTSANGVSAFAAATRERTTPALCVGDATAAAARQAGFARVESADGDAAALVARAQALFAPERGPLIHISGAAVAGDVIGALRAAGFAGERRVFYAADPSARLSDDVRARLAATPPMVDGVLFHSPRGAAIFSALMAATAPQAAPHLFAACLSENVARAAERAARWRHVVVAPAPREEALLEAAFAQTAP
ncbi:MAG: uroporphyrinogen-III synthase [Alphaproteobacteria bacterium]|nr:uroporphyrinogen-III synthase [Alphaproteobacteria bacterium]